MSRVSVQGIVGYSSPSDRALVRDAGGEPRCDPAKIPKEIVTSPRFKCMSLTLVELIGRPT